MESSLRELKKLVSMGWTYAVIWKIGPDHRTPVWHQSYLNESVTGAEVGLGQRFESIYRQCLFTTARPGYAYLAWQRQSPFWWTRLMEPVLTDKSKELFLSQAGIQTIVCFPGRAIPDGTGYCVELACTALVLETEFLRSSIQEFLNTAIDPHIPTPLLQEVPATLDIESWRQSSTSAMAALAHQTSAILTDITSQASMGENETIEEFGNILRPDEPYSSWTMSSTPFVSPEAPNFQSYEEGVVPNYPGFHDVSFNYATAPFPSELFEVANMQTQPASSEWASRKGKEIIVEESDLVLATGKQIPPLQNVNLLQQQELLEKLRSSPSAPPGSPNMLPPGIGSGYRGMGPPVGKMPPGHSPASLFRPHNNRPRFGVSKKKRLPLIYKWATSLVPWKTRFRDEIPDSRGAGGSSIDSLSPGIDNLLDPRSPSSVAHAHQAAVAHKIAERNRRLIFGQKMQTLISIVPMINKKKDKVSVLTSTIDYIRQLNLRITTIKKGDEEAAAPSTSRPEAEGAATTMDREEELTAGNEAGPSSSSPIGATGRGPVVVVVVKDTPEEDTWEIKVEANNHSRSLIQLLNVLLKLELGVVTMDYSSTNGRFHANLRVKKSSSTSRSELQATLCRVLETDDRSPTGSN